MIKENPVLPLKIFKTANQQTFGLLLSNCYSLIFELLLSELFSNF
jgi:hypothetical protein